MRLLCFFKLHLHLYIPRNETINSQLQINHFAPKYTTAERIEFYLPAIKASGHLPLHVSPRKSPRLRLLKRKKRLDKVRVLVGNRQVRFIFSRLIICSQGDVEEGKCLTLACDGTPLFINFVTLRRPCYEKQLSFIHADVTAVYAPGCLPSRPPRGTSITKCDIDVAD